MFAFIVDLLVQKGKEEEKKKEKEKKKAKHRAFVVDQTLNVGVI